jgi:membrane protein DedA with SNARE-associated domain
MADVSDETIVVALFAGVAGMLAIETRASAGVGVAISVTTIPAAAYFGIALGLGEAREATGALAVLSLNVLFLVIGAAGTLLLQRRRRLRRHGAPDVRPSSDRN